jgi:GTPase SAR1 family protein
MVSNTVKRD